MTKIIRCSKCKEPGHNSRHCSTGKPWFNPKWLLNKPVAVKPPLPALAPGPPTSTAPVILPAPPVAQIPSITIPTVVEGEHEPAASSSSSSPIAGSSSGPAQPLVRRKPDAASIIVRKRGARLRYLSRTEAKRAERSARREMKVADMESRELAKFHRKADRAAAKAAKATEKRIRKPKEPKPVDESVPKEPKKRKQRIRADPTVPKVKNPPSEKAKENRRARDRVRYAKKRAAILQLLRRFDGDVQEVEQVEEMSGDEGQSINSSGSGLDVMAQAAVILS